jgi:hypothetical protein
MRLLERTFIAAVLLSAFLVSAPAAETPLPDAIAAPGETVVLTLHAEGAQVYECKAPANFKTRRIRRIMCSCAKAEVGRREAAPI